MTIRDQTPMTEAAPTHPLCCGLFWLVPCGPVDWRFLTTVVRSQAGGPPLDLDQLGMLFETLWPALGVFDEDLVAHPHDDFPRGLVIFADDGSAHFRIDPCLNRPRLVRDLTRAFAVDLDRTFVRTDRRLTHAWSPPWASSSWRWL
ncbi:MAG: hypothetical protein WA208_16085 [Thermoanaerobaculia bacterium]